MLLRNCLVRSDRGAAGVIATNTTLGRDGLAPADRGRSGEAGGLSGRPLADRARQVVAFVQALDPAALTDAEAMLTAAMCRAQSSGDTARGGAGGGAVGEPGRWVHGNPPGSICATGVWDGWPARFEGGRHLEG